MGAQSKIRVGSLEGFRDLVFELGGDPVAILKKTQIDGDMWQTPDATISTEQYRYALDLAAIDTETPNFGLLLSQRQSFNKFGAVGYLISNSPNLQTAFAHLTSFIGTHDSSTAASLVVEDHVALISHTLSDIGTVSTIQQSELAVGLVCRFIRTAIDPHWSPEAVFFAHSLRERNPLYHRIFRCPVFFDHDMSGLEFPASDLQNPLMASDPKLYRILKNYVEQVNKTGGADIVNQVQQHIHQAIEAGSPSLGYVARRLSLTPPELQRRLKRRNTNFQSLLEQERFGLARKYLLDTQIPLSTITLMLGYAEPAVFSRAFKRLSGLPPRVWREQNRSQD